MSQATDLPVFTEALRYQYPLGRQSFVIDAGFHEGAFALEIAKLYSCEIEAYEPIQSYYEAGLTKLTGTKIRLIQAALGNSPRQETFHLKGCMTGAFAEGQAQQVRVLDAMQVIAHRTVDLLKLNIEGMEFEVLDRLVETGWIKACQDIQVQFHDCVPDAKARHQALQAKLLKTHYLTYNAPFCWENYRLK